MLKTIFILFLSMIGTVVFCGLFLFLFANSVHMTCTQQQDNTFTCQIEKRFFSRITTSRYTVTGVVGAKIVEDCDDGCSYRTELVTSDGRSEPFNDVFSDHWIAEQNTNKINAFIRQNDGPAFSVEEEMQWWVVIMLGAMGGIGLVVELAFVFREAYRWWVNRQTI